LGEKPGKERVKGKGKINKAKRKRDVGGRKEGIKREER